MKDQTTPDMNSLLQPFQQFFPQPYHDQIFLVGGTVRDFLMQQPAQDYDLIASLPEELLLSLGFRLVAGKSTRPIWFYHDAQLGKLELIRLDELCQLDADLRRRDFTINAIALSLHGRWYDPLDGQQDLQHIGPQHVRGLLLELTIQHAGNQVGMDFHPGIGSPDRRCPQIVQPRRRSPDQHDAPGEICGRNTAFDHAAT